MPWLLYAGVCFAGLSVLFAVEHVFGSAAANALAAAGVCFATWALLNQRK